MINILLWVSLISGGILVLLLLLSLLGGLELDVDIDTDGGETDSSGGGIGLLKGALTFVSVSSWVMRMIVAANGSIFVAIAIAAFAGGAAFWLLNKMFVLLLSNQENVNWKMTDAMYANGEVYLRVPATGTTGIVNVEIRGAIRELKAKSAKGIEIPTGTPVTIIDVDGDYAIVEPTLNLKQPI